MRAFVLRMAPGGVDWVRSGLEFDEISIGWGLARELMEPSLDYWQFREITKRHYDPETHGYKKAGSIAGMLWLFLREMARDDYVVVPRGGQAFVVAKVAGDPVYLPNMVSEHTAFRRPVHWLNNKESIPRRNARAALQSRMKIRQTCGDASDLVEEIRDAVDTASASTPLSFGLDLRSRLIDQAKLEMTSGRMDSYGFESLVATLLRSLGASDVRVVARSQDKGADIVASFALADTFRVRLAVQAKHFRPEPPVGADVIDQLVAGMEAEQISLGWVATSGSFSPEAVVRKAEVEEATGMSVELVDGDQLAAMLVEGGLRAVGYGGPQPES